MPFILDPSHLPPLKLMTACPPGGLATHYETGLEKQIALDIWISQFWQRRSVNPYRLSKRASSVEFFYDKNQTAVGG